MNIGRGSNPVFGKSAFQAKSFAQDRGEVMTVNGAINKSFILTLLVLLGASYTWKVFFNSWDASAVIKWIAIGGIGGFIAAMVTIFKKDWAPVSAPVYAILEGMFLGGISAFLEAQFPGLVIQAVALTFGTLLVMLLLYRSGIIKVTEKFKAGIFAATGAIALIYFVSFIMSFFGVQVPMIHSNGTLGIVFSLIVVVIAALNLVLDFDFIQKGAQAGAPKKMEWYAAFGLMVTLVWLYIEILRLLAKLASRD